MNMRIEIMGLGKSGGWSIGRILCEMLESQR